MRQEPFEINIFKNKYIDYILARCFFVSFVIQICVSQIRVATVSAVTLNEYGNTRASQIQIYADIVCASGFCCIFYL